MHVRFSPFLLLLSATVAIASSPDFRLGIDYSEWADPGVAQIATDNSGALYMLAAGAGCSSQATSCVIKLSADGKSVLWENDLTVAVATMAVDPSGGVYIVPSRTGADTSIYVEKLSATGAGVMWKIPLGVSISTDIPDQWILLAADSQGRSYVATTADLTYAGIVVRINAAGSAVDYTATLTGLLGSVAVDNAGGIFVAGVNSFSDTTVFLTHVAPNGTASLLSTIAPPQTSPQIGVDPNGNPVLYVGDASSFGTLWHFDSTGAITSSASVARGIRFAMDTAGNTYILSASDFMQHVRNSLALCGSQELSVFGPDGALLQGTFLVGATAGSNGQIATGPNSSVFVLNIADTTFEPTQNGPFPQSSKFLMHLSPHADAPTFPLACVGNAASYEPSPIAPGELVTLFGTGLGPQQGVQTQAFIQSPFPSLVDDVQVTFDGLQAPLLWVQDGQVNAVVPWSLTPGENTQVCVLNAGTETNCLTWPVQSTSSGVFTVDGQYAAALNQDGTVNSAEHPAPQGSWVTIFATGLGPITPPQADGSLANFPLPANVMFAGVDADPGYGDGSNEEPEPLDVNYAGPAPYLVTGVSQINFKAQGDVQFLFVTITSAADLSFHARSPEFQIYYQPPSSFTPARAGKRAITRR